MSNASLAESLKNLPAAQQKRARADKAIKNYLEEKEGNGEDRDWNDEISLKWII